MTSYDADPFQPSEEALEQELGKVVAVFTIHKIPQGGAPDAIKRDWIGVGLPIRERLLNEQSGRQVYRDHLSGELKDNLDTIPVYGFDATAALRSVGRNRAADFWRNQGFEFATLNFRGHEGVLTSRSDEDA